MDVLVRIKRLVFQGRVRYSDKALDEMAADDLMPSDAEESILNAQVIAKTLQSPSRTRGGNKEKLYVIKSFSYTGSLIYTKGKIDRRDGQETYYILISAKLSTISE